MRSRLRHILCLGLLFALPGCQEGLHQSCVPSYAVDLNINTELGAYVKFVPENVYTHMTIDDYGYHFDGNTLPLTAGIEPHGYMGVVVFINGGGEYVAYDLCCPHCYTNGLRKGSPDHGLKALTIDGFYATCPICGSQYDLTGYGTPVGGSKGGEGIFLRKFSAYYSNHHLSIHN